MASTAKPTLTRRQHNQVSHRVLDLRCIAGELRRIQFPGFRLKVIAGDLEQAAKQLAAEVK